MLNWKNSFLCSPCLLAEHYFIMKFDLNCEVYLLQLFLIFAQKHFRLLSDTVYKYFQCENV